MTDLTDDLPESIVHIAGLNIYVPTHDGKRHQIQRCAACGEIMARSEEHPAASGLVGANGQPVGGHISFPPAAMVRFTRTGPAEYSATPAQPIPDGPPLDFCGYVVPNDASTIEEPTDERA